MIHVPISAQLCLGGDDSHYGLFHRELWVNLNLGGTSLSVLLMCLLGLDILA